MISFAFSSTLVALRQVLEDGTRVGDRSLVGTHAVLRSGCVVPEDAVVAPGGGILPKFGSGDTSTTRASTCSCLWELVKVIALRWPVLLAFGTLATSTVVAAIELCEELDGSLTAALAIAAFVVGGCGVTFVFKSCTSRIIYGALPCTRQRRPVVRWVAQIAMPLNVLARTFEVFIQNSFLLVKLWQAEGADIMNPDKVCICVCVYV